MLDNRKNLNNASNRLAAIQMTSRSSIENNLRTVGELVKQAVGEGAKLVALPENVAIVGKTDLEKLEYAEDYGQGVIQDYFSNLAKQHKVWIVGGTIPIQMDAQIKNDAHIKIDSQKNKINQTKKFSTQKPISLSPLGDKTAGKAVLDEPQVRRKASAMEGASQRVGVRGPQEKVSAACIVWDDKGKVQARYDKIHLFDVTIKRDTDQLNTSTKEEIYSESYTIASGEKVIIVDTPVGKIGLSVCYDLRFPELYRKMVEKGAEIFIVPSAFTEITGQAHWEVLLRARAIENLCYVVAPAQVGLHDNGRKTFGHSMIIDPWGKVLACQEKGEGIVVADIDLNYLREIRKKFPVLMHRKLLE